MRCLFPQSHLPCASSGRWLKRIQTLLRSEWKTDGMRRRLLLFFLVWMRSAPTTKRKWNWFMLRAFCALSHNISHKMWTALINDGDGEAVEQWKERKSGEQIRIIWVNQKCNSSSCAAHVLATDARNSADDAVDAEWRGCWRGPTPNLKQQLSALKKFWIVRLCWSELP